MAKNPKTRVQCIPSDEFLPAPGEYDFDKLSDEDQKIAQDWWFEHDYCVVCMEIFALADGNYEPPNGDFLCMNCKQLSQR